jgi:hypothetical protein
MSEAVEPSEPARSSGEALHLFRKHLVEEPTKVSMPTCSPVRSAPLVKGDGGLEKRARLAIAIEKTSPAARMRD